MAKVRAKARLEVLSGWKEIANYLHRGVRTVQRYEREMGFPIHRPAGNFSVVAVRNEVDEWVTRFSHADSMTKRRALDAKTNRLRANFLKVDSAIALTFSRIALQTANPDKKRRIALIARKAYDTIMWLAETTDLSNAESDTLKVNLQRLKSELESLGQRFSD